MGQITHTGNLFIQFNGESKPAPISTSFALEYSEKSANDYVYTAVQTNVALAMGSVTNPRCVVLEVTEGTVEFSWHAAGTGSWSMSANPTPATGDPPARMLFFTFSAEAATLYITTTGPVKFKAWFFE